MPRPKQQPLTKQQRAEINSLFVRFGTESDTIDEVVKHFTNNRTRSLSSYEDKPVTEIEAQAILEFLIPLRGCNIATELQRVKKEQNCKNNQRWNSETKFRQ